MNASKHLLAVSAAMALTFADAANTYEVHNVDELTNACAKATTNFDTIKVYPGTYDLTGITMASETLNKETHYIHLNFKANYMKILGMGATPDETIIKGGGDVDKQRLMVFANGATAKNYCTVSNLTFTGGYVDTAAGSGGVCVAKNQTFIDCRFIDNYAGNFAGALDQPTKVVHCYFKNNNAANSGGVSRNTDSVVGSFVDCTFVNNSATKNGGCVCYGASIYTGCTFVQNSSPAGFGVLRAGGAKSSFTDCVFSNNYAATSYAICDAVGGITNCTFVGNSVGVWNTSGDTLIYGCPSIVNCLFACNTGMPMIVNSTMLNCVFRGNVGHRANSSPLFGASTFYNCLLAYNRGGFHNMSTLIGDYTVGKVAKPSSVYNCTIVSNEYCAINHGRTVDDYSVMQGGVCINTIMADNILYSDTTWTTAVCQDIGAVSPVMMTNCLWTAQSAAPSAEKAIGCQLVTDAQLRFTDAANGDYTIQRKSVARDAGWSDAAYRDALGTADLKGDPRVYGDAIDIGAYECCITAHGFMLILR